MSGSICSLRKKRSKDLAAEVEQLCLGHGAEGTQADRSRAARDFDQTRPATCHASCGHHGGPVCGQDVFRVQVEKPTGSSRRRRRRLARDKYGNLHHYPVSPNQVNRRSTIGQGGWDTLMLGS